MSSAEAALLFGSDFAASVRGCAAPFLTEGGAKVKMDRCAAILTGPRNGYVTPYLPNPNRIATKY